jgi:hypothetical protein
LARPTGRRQQQSPIACAWSPDRQAVR